MKSKSFFAIAIAAGLLIAAYAAQTPDTGVVKFDQEKVAALLARGGGTLLTNSSFKVIASHREGPGVVELHVHDTDVMYILEGSATFITGGTGSEMKPTPADASEVRGKEITGGEEHHLVKGDVIMIPSGVPHWFKDTSKPFTSFIVKVTK
jgi:quercetin dioxygenase-like cupin family protein